MRILLSLFMVWAWPLQALAWGDEGHKVIGIIAEHFLEPTVRQKVDAITAASSLLRSSPPLSGASVLSALRLEPLVPFPLASPARFSRSLQEPG